jgi:hypothetical protein
MDVPPPDTRPPASAAPSSTSLLALLRHDQRQRWLHGDRVSAEWYLERHPDLAAGPEAVLDLAYAEFVLREDLGEAPTDEEYLARFTGEEQQAGRDRQLLTALLEVRGPTEWPKFHKDDRGLM